MNPQLLMPSPAADFNFDSTSTSPYATAPSSPKILFPRFFSPHEVEQEADHMDFAFDFSGQLDRPSISDADELFDGGKIKPLEPPPPPSSTLNLKKPFSETFHRTPGVQTQNPPPRGRNRTTAGAAATRSNKVSRSLSPMRVSDVMSDDRNNRVGSSNQSSQFGFTWYNKWNLKNLLLFRSTSEGSAAAITKDVKNSSFRSCDGGGSVGGSSRRRMKRKVSAHEIHYTANRAVAEEMRRKTFLPYKSGLLGCLGFSHNLHEVSRGGR
ncbi:hypothetical protein SSX86_005613 [Deinandra increscens subsp. villosa]|uniref:Uncharacterized protein n=1 Tax=Deinandra increscens subsp. villosa TaxID=3103831 RepID=A0AAP0DLJ8_9ASTR